MTWVCHSLTGWEPGSDTHWHGVDLALTWRRPGSDTHYQGGDLGLTLTDRADTWPWHSLTGRGNLGVTLTDRAGTWVWHSLTRRGPGCDTHWLGGDLGLTLTDRAETSVWHSLTERGPGSDTHWQGGDLGLTLTEGAGTQAPPCQWVSDPGPRHVITQVPALSAGIRPSSPSCQWASDPCPRHVSECQTQVPALLVAGPDGSFVSTVACNLEVPGSNPGRAWYLSSWLCIYSAPNCPKEWNVQCCLWYRAL